MRVGLLSDSHGQARRTASALKVLQEHGAKIFLHMGDVETEQVLDELAGLDARLVFGNNDDERVLGSYARALGIQVLHPLGRIEIDGRRIAFTHGHIGWCMAESRATDVDFFIHGHTHRCRDEMRGTTRLINPGALHRASPYTVAILDPSAATVEFFPVK